MIDYKIIYCVIKKLIKIELVPSKRVHITYNCVTKETIFNIHFFNINWQLLK